MIIVLEKDTDGFWAWLEEVPDEFKGIHTFAATIDEVTANVRMLMKDFIKNDFPDEPKFKDFKPETLTFTYKYSLIDFFDTFNDLKIGSIAKRAGMNASLLRQYASGAANASVTQVQKIQEAVHSLAHSLLQTAMV